MFCSKYDVDKNSSYMDGIPVKISEQYKPPKKISVPSGVLNRHTVEIDEYDFRLEKSMIKKMDELRELRRIAAEKRKQRLEMEDQCGNGEVKSSSTITEGVSRLNVQSPEPSAIQQSTQLSQPSATVPVSQQQLPQCTSYHIQGGEQGVQGVHSHSDPILTPVPVTSHPYSHQTVLNKSFNISDFESDTSSPFDNMELKTLNDIEELAHVLQPNLNSNNCDISCPSSSHPPRQEVNSLATHLTCSEQSSLSSISKKTGDTFTPRINGMNSLHYSNYNNLISNNMWPQYNLLHYHNNHSQHLNHNHHSYLSTHNTWAQSILPSSYNPNIQSYVVQRLDHLETDHLPQQQCNPLQHHVQMPTTASASAEATSKSVPDIIQELILELKDKRASEEQRTKKILNEPARSARIGPIEDELEKKSFLPNPFDQLSHLRQQLCMRISEMGFPLPRVARAVQYFSDNETKVLEFLLQIQHLEEGGCPPDRAEMALVANKYNLSEAIRYLESLKQLLDLGFVEKKVIEALERHSNDRDKALESLIS